LIGRSYRRRGVTKAGGGVFPEYAIPGRVIRIVMNKVGFPKLLMRKVARENAVSRSNTHKPLSRGSDILPIELTKLLC
jgi:hypothetical protein